MMIRHIVRGLGLLFWTTLYICSKF